MNEEQGLAPSRAKLTPEEEGYYDRMADHFERKYSDRSYESELKELLEDICQGLNREALKLFYMPQNVPGVPRITLAEWLEAREKKRSGED